MIHKDGRRHQWEKNREAEGVELNEEKSAALTDVTKEIRKRISKKDFCGEQSTVSPNPGLCSDPQQLLKSLLQRQRQCPKTARNLRKPVELDRGSSALCAVHLQPLQGERPWQSRACSSLSCGGSPETHHQETVVNSHDEAAQFHFGKGPVVECLVVQQKQEVCASAVVEKVCAEWEDGRCQGVVRSLA